MIFSQSIRAKMDSIKRPDERMDWIIHAGHMMLKRIGENNQQGEFQLVHALISLELILPFVLISGDGVVNMSL